MRAWIGSQVAVVVAGAWLVAGCGGRQAAGGDAAPELGLRSICGLYDQALASVAALVQKL